MTTTTSKYCTHYKGFAKASKHNCAACQREIVRDQAEQIQALKLEVWQLEQQLDDAYNDPELWVKPWD